MLYDIIEKGKYDLQHWDWNKKKEEIKTHFYKYRIHYILATILIFIIVILDAQPIPTIIHIGGEDTPKNQSADTPKNQSADIPKNQSGDTPKNQSGDTPKNQSGDTPNNKSGDTPKNQSGNAMGSNIDPKESKGDNKGGKGAKGGPGGIGGIGSKNPFAKYGSYVGSTISNFGGGVADLLQKFLKGAMVLFVIIFIAIIPSLIYLILVYLLFKLMIKGTTKL